MTERSRFWDGVTTGDATAAPYDAHTEFAAVMNAVSGASGITNKGGVILGDGNALNAVGSSSPVTLRSGSAIVQGTWYENDADISIAIPTPGAATRIDRIVLRKNWITQTVRITVISGVEGGGAPAYTQTLGVIWDIPLWQVSITTLGAITLTDERIYAPRAANAVDAGAVVRVGDAYYIPAATTSVIWEANAGIGYLGFTEFDTPGAAIGKTSALLVAKFGIDVNVADNGLNLRIRLYNVTSVMYLGTECNVTLITGKMEVPYCNWTGGRLRFETTLAGGSGLSSFRTLDTCVSLIGMRTGM